MLDLREITNYSIHQTQHYTAKAFRFTYKPLYSNYFYRITHMISMKARYAIQALVHMASRTGDCSFVARKIAEAENIPQKFLEEILLDLRKEGILRSKTGKCGGYYFQLLPETVKLKDVLRAINDPLATEPWSTNNYRINIDRLSLVDYLLDPVEKRLVDACYRVLEDVSLADLVRAQNERLFASSIPNFQI